MGGWIFIFFIVVIVVTTQNITAGVAFTILGIIFFLLFSADNKKPLSQIKTIQTFRLKGIQNIHKSIHSRRDKNLWLSYFAGLALIYL